MVDDLVSGVRMVVVGFKRLKMLLPIRFGWYLEMEPDEYPEKVLGTSYLDLGGKLAGELKLSLDLFHQKVSIQLGSLGFQNALNDGINSPSVAGPAFHLHHPAWNPTPHTEIPQLEYLETFHAL